MDLLELPSEIQNGLLHPPAPLEMHSFPERRLRILVRCPNRATKMESWDQLVQDLRNSAGK
jgi:hypothetical protein